MILEGDSLEVLKTLENNSVDTVITDPPYGYSFMGKDWDKAVPSVEIWQECLRVLKPGAFCCVMSAPRSDVQNAMISRLMEAGFRLDFTPIYWTYASGFPKAGDTAKLVDKRMGVESEVIGYSKAGKSAMGQNSGWNDHANTTEPAITRAVSPEAKALEGSKLGFQPKPAVEVIIVAMKPLSEKTYVDQALANGHGVSWLDDCKIPYGDDADMASARPQGIATSKVGALAGGTQNDRQRNEFEVKLDGRFPANILASDMVIGEHSRYFDLDNWYKKQNAPQIKEHFSSTYPQDDYTTLPFLITPKASKNEKNKGLEGIEKKLPAFGNDKGDGLGRGISNTRQDIARANHHPTVKPLKLMSYLITLFSRPGDTVLDPFVGSGTTVVAAKQLGREGIGIEREAEYAEIARARLAHVMPQLPAEKPEEGQPPIVISEAIKDNEQLRLV